MKLLSRQSATTILKQNNDELIDKNIRLRKFEGEITQRLNGIKESYEPEKVAKLKEFELFCKDIQLKKSKLLQELNVIEREIEKKKEIYYGLIEKQDLLDEKVYQAEEVANKLNLREAFVIDLEKKWRDKQKI